MMKKDIRQSGYEIYINNLIKEDLVSSELEVSVKSYLDFDKELLEKLYNDKNQNSAMNIIYQYYHCYYEFFVNSKLPCLCDVNNEKLKDDEILKKFISCRKHFLLEMFSKCVDLIGYESGIEAAYEFFEEDLWNRIKKDRIKKKYFRRSII